MLLALCALAGCYSENKDTTATLGTVGAPVEPTPTTLLPDVVDTESDITITVPEGTLFNGDLCSALVAADFTSISIGGLAPGELVDSGALSPDACGYTVHSGRTDLQINVSAQTEQAFLQPPVAAEAVANTGQGAIRYERADGTFMVVVKVVNGYFSVQSPDGVSAVKLAKLAAGRAGA